MDAIDETSMIPKIKTLSITIEYKILPCEK